MESYSPLIGTPVEELDTPCLLLDLDALEHNFDVVSRTYEGKVCKMREHGKNIKSPVVGLLQIRAGGTVGGVCSAKVSEAEAMVAGGIEDILITNQVVTRDKIVRLCGLAKQADIKVAVDDKRNLRDLSAAAVDSGATLGIVIEVDTSMSRAGVRTTQEGVELARLAVELPGLVFRGVMSHQTLGGRSGDLETRKRVGEKFIQMCLDVRDAIEEAGIPVEIVSSGETFTYDIAAAMPGVTEVQGGTYALMTHRSVLGNVFKVAMKVLASVTSAPRPGVAIGDVGYRAISSSANTLHVVEDLPDVRVESLQEDHVVLRSEGPMPLAAGDRFIFLPGVQDGTVNRWDQYIAVRNGIVEAVWDIPGRGRFN